MDKREERELLMCDEVVKCIKAEVTTDVPAIAEIANEISASAVSIRKHEEDLKKDTKGVTKTKNVSKKSLANDVYVIAGGILGVGNKNNDENLKAIGGIVEAVLLNASDAQFPITCRNILSTAKGIEAAKLEYYGITQQMITDAETGVESFTESKSKVGNARVDKGSARDMQDILFDEISQKLELLDRLVKRYEKSKPEFYNRYQIARVVVDAPVRHEEPGTTPAPNETPVPNQ